MSKMIFINLPVTDVARSVAFYEALGMTREPRFSNEQAAMMRWSDEISFMLLAHDFYRGFAPGKPIADAHAASGVLLCLSTDSRAEVDTLCDKAAAAGGRVDVGPVNDQPFMYGRSFEDPDGHHFEPMWMVVDAATAAQAEAA